MIKNIVEAFRRAAVYGLLSLTTLFTFGCSPEADVGNEENLTKEQALDAANFKKDFYFTADSARYRPISYGKGYKNTLHVYEENLQIDTFLIDKPYAEKNDLPFYLVGETAYGMNTFALYGDETPDTVIYTSAVLRGVEVPSKSAGIFNLRATDRKDLSWDEALNVLRYNFD